MLVNMSQLSTTYGSSPFCLTLPDHLICASVQFFLPVVFDMFYTIYTTIRQFQLNRLLRRPVSRPACASIRQDSFVTGAVDAVM